ncbi:tetratricopeptide repeat-containing sulfotransferase family protein [Oceanobacter mangrovi]|uniref:tetratricopeptide repeat-containing sulfotransferase family protein n=1 Tax=Oceanobacter mangrovi TaxID=2862510 RepID=UPI0031BBCC6B
MDTTSESSSVVKTAAAKAKTTSAQNSAKENKAAQKPVKVSLPGRPPQVMPGSEALAQAQRLLASQQTAAAIPLLQQLTSQLPALAAGWLMLLDALNRVGDLVGVGRAAEACLQHKPRFVAALTSLSLIKRINQQHAEALALIDKAIKQEPANAELHNHHGVILKEMGQMDKALSSFQRCLALQPNNANAIWNRSDMIHQLDEYEYQQLQKLAASNQLQANKRAMIYYALGRSDEAGGRYAEQFDNIAAGAELKRSVIPYQHDTELIQFDKAIEAFPAAPVVTPTEQQAKGPIPIFICGLPRSGTTLTEQILSSHPSVTAGDEINDLPLACGKLLARKGIRKSFPDWSGDLTEQDWQTIGETYLSSTRALHGGGWFTDKNLQNYKAVGLIRKSLPQARIVICRRDPMDNLWGCYRQFFSDGQYFTYRQQELADIWNATDRLIKHWQATGKDIFVMDYETLIAEPEPTIRALLDFVGLPWDENCLNFHQNKRSVRTLSATQVRQPLSNSRVAQWKRYEQQLQPMLQRLQLDDPA